MTKIIGRLSSVGIGKETVRGTSVAPTYWVPWMEVSAEDRLETVIDETSLARLESSDAEAGVSKFGEITLKSKLKDKHIGMLLLSLFGTDTVGNPDTGVYDHVYTVAQSTQHQSLTVAIKDANFDLRMANAVVSELKLTGEVGNYIMYEANLLSKASASASNTVSHAQENDFLPQHLVFKKANAQSGLDAASAVTIKGFEINIKANAIKEDVLGSIAPNDILNQGFDISGSITLVHNDSTWKDLMLNETYQALRIQLVFGTAISGSYYPTLTIDLHRARITNYERKLALNDLVEESFDFKAHYSLTDSKMVTTTLRNTVSSY